MKTIPVAKINGMFMCRAEDVYVAIDYATEKERFRCAQLIQDVAGSVLIGSVSVDDVRTMYTSLDVAEILLQVAADVSGENAE